MVPVRRNQNWSPSIFNDFLGNDWLAERHNTTAPAVNIIEDENEYKVEVAAPGMTKEDFKVHINEDNELIVTMEKKGRAEGGGQKEGHVSAPRVFLHEIPAEPAAARQRRAREDRGQGRERRDDHRDSQEERDGSRRCGPPDRGQIACGHSMMGRENPLNGFSFFATAAVGDGRWRSAGMRNGRPRGRPSFVSVRGGEWGRDDPTGPGRRARRRGNPSVRRIPRPARSVRSHPRVALRNGPRRAPRVRAPDLSRARRARRTAFRAGRLRCPQRLRIRFRNPL